MERPPAQCGDRPVLALTSAQRFPIGHFVVACAPEVADAVLFVIAFCRVKAPRGGKACIARGISDHDTCTSCPQLGFKRMGERPANPCALARRVHSDGQHVPRALCHLFGHCVAYPCDSLALTRCQSDGIRRITRQIVRDHIGEHLAGKKLCCVEDSAQGG